jgi:hypothetical protein
MGAPDLVAMRSESIPGLSVITLSFSDTADPHIARQGVAERVNCAFRPIAGRRRTAGVVAARLEHHGLAEGRADRPTSLMPIRCATALTGF